ncbi:1-acyl-sn-glycerol-3-phosphate acyltransferase [Paraliomyxa miuraensis]|uniref:1-acyl-sn-glycerol-3-phosphate acyltransferase n=1 Tax=Paraliomyxa miuraensis TaxID=376150 RepID=UPI0022531A63|nr:1-acyl-sn-glycerol-3-phosphate acyltransferase [Paraliomyxa miuraensis]MCX4240475.1 1-acyl-sn-glycerol-3-phosphate acyltransferase [Paraliomyxa miuraensis]
MSWSTLRAMGGWRYEGELPAPRKAVCLAVPHSSNLDGLLLVALAQSIGMSISWMVKDSMGKPPHGWVVKGVGGVPIERSRPHGVVGQMIEEFARRDDFYLVIPPEGTRSRVEYWKSGFYHIALGAEVPVLPGYLDFRRKVGGFGPPITLTGDVRADMDAIREFYGPDVAAMAQHPERIGPMRMREEERGDAEG